MDVRVEIIEIGSRKRALDTAAVSRLAQSMKENGLLHPITIRIADMMVIDGHEVEGVPVLVAGLHRLEAAKQLGWSHISCTDIGDDEIKAELWELAENLHRCDLTKEQRDDHIRRYAELLDLQSRQAVRIESKREDGRGHRPEGIPSKIARDTGLSARTIQRVLNPVEPKPVVDGQDAIRMQANRIIAAWNTACPEARELAMDEIDDPVFDRTACA